MEAEKEKKSRKTYEKPRLRVIELAAEEVLGVGCKSASGGFARGAAVCMFSTCAGAGS